MNSPKANDSQPSPRASQTPALVVAWLVVGIPAAWGVWQVVVKSLALFGR